MTGISTEVITPDIMLFASSTASPLLFLQKQVDQSTVHALNFVGKIVFLVDKKIRKALIFVAMGRGRYNLCRAC